MKAIILAGGRGERLRPLTCDKPKALVEVKGKSLLEHTIDALPLEVDELILVIGYLGDQIKKFCGDNFKGRKVNYVWQKEQLGTGHALSICGSHLRRERFFVLFADDLIGGRGLQNCLKHNLCILAQEHNSPSRFGVISLRNDGSVKQILEKPEKPPTNLVCVGPMVLDGEVFNYEVGPAANGEYYLSRMVSKMAGERQIFLEKADFWLPIASPEDIKMAEKINLSIL